MNNSIKFCEKCNNLMFIHIDEEEKLIFSCKTCKHISEYTEDNCIHKSRFTRFDVSQTINKNKYITHDNTLPSIKGNINLKCPNKDCEFNSKDNHGSYKYIKYDEKDVKYMYICEACGQKWKL